MIILLTGNHHIDSDGNIRFNLPVTYTNRVQENGAVPVMAESGNAKALAQMADKLILTGGVDVDGAYFEEENMYGSIIIDKKRDEFEFALLDAFVGEKKPVLGICRGIQVINVYFGGSLYLDLPAQLGLNHSGTGHAVEIVQGSKIYSLYGGEMTVNSSHHQSVRALGNGLYISARARDGVLEALEHTTLPILGVQWHPERMENDCLMEWFVKKFG